MSGLDTFDTVRTMHFNIQIVSYSMQLSQTRLYALKETRVIAR